MKPHIPEKISAVANWVSLMVVAILTHIAGLRLGRGGQPAGPGAVVYAHLHVVILDARTSLPCPLAALGMLRKARRRVVSGPLDADGGGATGAHGHRWRVNVARDGEGGRGDVDDKGVESLNH